MIKIYKCKAAMIIDNNTEYFVLNGVSALYINLSNHLNNSIKYMQLLSPFLQIKKFRHKKIK